MLDVISYIKLVLKKKNMSNMDFVRAINKVEEKTGVKERTLKQNINSYFNGNLNLGYDMARRMELALDLKDKTLIDMLPKPKTKLSRDALNSTMKKWKKG